MRRPVHSVAACLLVLGSTASGLASCTQADCADLGTCAGATPDGAGADAAPTSQSQDAETEAPAPPAKNPYGKDYPTENLGWSPRKRGSSTPGNVIPNVVFDTAIRVQSVAPKAGTFLDTASLQLADFFDPDRRTHDVIVLALSTVWDASSKPFLEGLGRAPDKTVVVSVLGEGPLPSGSASMGDLQRWASDYYWAWNVLDGGFAQLGKIEGVATGSMPAVVLIDATTMELAYFNAGPVSAGTLGAEIAEIRLRQ